MLQPPEPPSRPLSIRTTGTTATAKDKSGQTWMMSVDKDNCWEDLILTLGAYSCSALFATLPCAQGARIADRVRECRMSAMLISRWLLQYSVIRAQRIRPYGNLCCVQSLTSSQMAAVYEATPACSYSNSSCTKSPNASADYKEMRVP